MFDGTDEEIAARIGEALRNYRLREDVSQSSLAIATGMARPTLRALEAGNGTLLNFIAVLRALGRLDLLYGLLAVHQSIVPPPSKHRAKR